MTFYLDNIVYQHSRGSDPVINDLSLMLCPGPVLLLGRNGAGKTTLLRLVAGLLKPKSGKIHCSGRVLYLPQNFVSVPGFTCLEYVSHLAWLNGQGRRQAKTEAPRWLAAVGLDGYERHSCQKLSGGQQSRLALAMALNSGSELVLLDEPGAALDPLSKEMLRELYTTVVNAGVNLVVSSHDPVDILGPFARVVIIDRGAVRFDDSPQALRSNTHADPLVAAFARSMFPQELSDTPVNPAAEEGF